MTYQNHQVNHVGVKLVSDYPDLIHDEYKQFDGSNCMIEFLNYCLDVQDKCINILNDKIIYILIGKHFKNLISNHLSLLKIFMFVASLLMVIRY